MAEKNIPAISVIIPMYNAEKYIGQLLDSILAQTFTDYEVIVVDDCSKDDSAKIVESYAEKFTRGGVERLKFIRLKVRGCIHKGKKLNYGYEKRYLKQKSISD